MFPEEARYPPIAIIVAMGRERWTDDECRLWSNLQGPRLAANFRGAEHITPSDAIWLARDGIQTGSLGPDRTIEALRDYTAAFLDSSLPSRENPASAGTATERPNVTVITRGQPLCRPR